MKRFLPMLFGILFVAIGVFMYFRNESLIKNCTVEAKATVVDIEEELSDDNDYIYFPVIEYKVNEDTIRVKMSSGSSSPKYSLKDEVAILYNPNKTKEFIVKGDKSSNIFSIIFSAIGIFVTVYGIIMIVKKEELNN